LRFAVYPSLDFPRGAREPPGQVSGWTPAACNVNNNPFFSTLGGMARSTDILQEFCQRVRQLRKERGYSQEGFAGACGLDRTYMGGIERGERNVALRNIQVIARTLKISLSELVKGL
jgi:DNA-binding XRE family transcriptional regulator